MCWHPFWPEIRISTHFRQDYDLTSVSLARLSDEDHADDIVLIDTPPGRALLYAVLKAGAHEFVVQTPAGERRELTPLETGWPELVYLPTGHILFRKNPVENPSLWAVPFSPTTLATTGDAFIVEPSGQGMSIANDGTLVYLDVGRSKEQVLAWRDRTGKVLARAAEGHEVIQAPRHSPDGTRAIVVATYSGHLVLWMYDVRRFAGTRFAMGRESEGKNAVFNVWTGAAIRFFSRSAIPLPNVSWRSSRQPTETASRGSCHSPMFHCAAGHIAGRAVPAGRSLEQTRAVHSSLVPADRRRE